MSEASVVFQELGPDVRHLDERRLRQAAVAGDPEAFAELMRRYEPVVREQMLRVLRGSNLIASDTLDELLAEFWCALLEDRMSRLRAWTPERGVRLDAWLGLLAWQSSVAQLRQLAEQAAQRLALAEAQQPQRGARFLGFQRSS